MCRSAVTTAAAALAPAPPHKLGGGRSPWGPPRPPLAMRRLGVPVGPHATAKSRPFACRRATHPRRRRRQPHRRPFGDWPQAPVAPCPSRGGANAPATVARPTASDAAGWRGAPRAAACAGARTGGWASRCLPRRCDLRRPRRVACRRPLRAACRRGGRRAYDVAAATAVVPRLGWGWGRSADAQRAVVGVRQLQRGLNMPVVFFFFSISVAHA